MHNVNSSTIKKLVMSNRDDLIFRVYNPNETVLYETKS